MKKGRVLLTAISTLFVAFLFLKVFSGGLNKAHAAEKRKVLLLQIIEENWDNLEFMPPMYKRDPYYKPLTKKEMMKFKKMDVEKSKEDAVKNLKFRLSRGEVPKDLKIYIFHYVRYFGETGELKDTDSVDEDTIRLSMGWRHHYSKEIPGKFPLTHFPEGRDEKCLHIRLVNDLYILSSKNEGDLEIKYGGKTYKLKVGHRILFPSRSITLTKKKIEEEGCRADIILTKGDLHFKTKVTIINYGYIILEP